MVLNTNKLTTKRKKRKQNIDIRKLNGNFYLLIRKQKWWNSDEIKFIKKYLNYKLFSPIPKAFIDVSIFGYNCSYGFYEKICPKYVLFNFDCKNDKPLSLRGMCVVTNNGIAKTKNNYNRYFTIELIGNKSITNHIVKRMKQKNNIQIKSGKDIILFWKEFGKRSYFNYCKLYAMEDVLGFYWKYGWRFGSNFNYFKKKERIIHEHIKKLNLVNFKYKKNKELKLLYKRDKLLVKYFDKYMENYYSDYKMINYRLINTDIHDYLLTNTLHLQRFNMRFHGYPMYLNCN